MKKEPEEIICFLCEDRATSFQNDKDWKNSLIRVRCDKCGEFLYDRNFGEYHLDLSFPNNPKLKKYDPATLEEVRAFLINQIKEGKVLSGVELGKFLNSS